MRERETEGGGEGIEIAERVSGLMGDAQDDDAHCMTMRTDAQDDDAH